jgi:hypothetical protein
MAPIKMTKLIVASHNLAKAPTRQEIEFAFRVGPLREIIFFSSFFLQKVVFLSVCLDNAKGY